MLNHSRRIVSRSDSVPRISFSASVIVLVRAALALPRLPRRYLAGVASLTTPVNYLSAVQSRGLFMVHPLASSLARRHLSAPLRSGAQAASLGRNLGSDARRILRGQGVRRYRRPFCNLRSEQVRTLAQLLSCRHPWQLWLPSAVVWASIGHGMLALCCGWAILHPVAATAAALASAAALSIASLVISGSVRSIATRIFLNIIASLAHPLS